MIYLDLETTGLNPNTDEILQIGILAEDGMILMSKHIKPAYKQSWNQAQRIHNISPKDVENCPSLLEVTPD